MIKIKKVKKEYQLFIDDVFLDKVEVSDNYVSNFYEISTINIEDSQKILTHKWNDFPKLIAIKARLQNIGPFVTDLFIETEPTKQKKLRITFAFEVEIRDWKGNYSFSEYIKEYKKLWSGIDNLGGDLRFFEDDIVELEITYLIVNKNEAIIDLISRYQNFLTEVHQKVSDKLLTINSTKNYLEIFTFPEELRIPCEQYLQYFAKFLQDLGINATSNLKEEAGKVLFSVTPIDDVEALDKIREALAVYLNLPSSPIIYDDSFAAMRLKQQVDNLQHAQRMSEMEVRSSQYALRLANQTIEHQDKIIQQKDTTIEQQNKIIERITDKAIMVNSAENKEELEEIFDGVKVGKSKFLAEQLGLHLNPATAIKSVGKKIIGGDNDIISLDLNKE